MNQFFPLFRPFRKASVAVVMAGFSAVSASTASALVVLDVGAMGSPEFQNIEILVDMPVKTYNDLTEEVEGDETQFGGAGGSDTERTAHFDFGEDWMNVRIYQTWSYSRTFAPSTPDTPTGYIQLWWDDDFVGDTFQPGEGDIEETTLNFFLNQTGGVSNTWFLDVDLTSGTPITPSARYLLVTTPTAGEFANPGTFSEVAFVGEVIPEPSTSILCALVGLGRFIRRNRSNAALDA
jgi:hypothetical protein